MLLHQMLGGKKPKRVVIPHELASAIVQYHALRDPCFHVGCVRVNLQLNTQREGNRGGSCHIKNRAPVGYLMSPCHHPLLLPHISGIMFVPQSHG